MVLTWQNKKYILETFSALKNLVINCRKELVVYFNQFLGAGYSKRLLKHAFLFILHQKIKKLKKKEKARKSRQILAKNMFFECPLKQVFRCIKLYFLGIKPSNSVWVNFDYICHRFPIWKFAHTMTQVSAFSFFFSFLARTKLKNQIFTRVWSGQHPNTGQNIQQALIVFHTIPTQNRQDVGFLPQSFILHRLVWWTQVEKT